MYNQLYINLLSKQSVREHFFIRFAGVPQRFKMKKIENKFTQHK